MERLPSYPMRDYRLEWEVRDENNKIITRGAQALPDLANVRTIAERLQPLAQTSALRLHLTLLTPTGSIAAENSVDWHRSEVESKTGTVPVTDSGGAPAPTQ
jgi:hypothetical protein